jgi:hypothetical protein
MRATSLAARTAVLAAAFASASCSAQPAAADAPADAPAMAQAQAAPASVAAATPAETGWSVSRDAKGCTLAGPSQFANVPAASEEDAPLRPWSTGTMSWSGACPGGKADGVGVARMMDGGKPVAFWYGRADMGRIGAGVIVDGHGTFDAVQASGGEVRVIGMDEPARAQARDLGRQALNSYVASLQGAGNAASAAHYRQHVEVIAAMDEGE